MLGKAAGYSPWYTAVIFKKLTDKTPGEYIRQLRLTKAALRLRDENNKIIEVAMEQRV
jgi:AraC-like DNA-binding protein